MPGREAIAGLLHLGRDPLGRDAVLARRSGRRIQSEVDDRNAPTGLELRLQALEVGAAARDVVIRIDDERELRFASFSFPARSFRNFTMSAETSAP